VSHGPQRPEELAAAVGALLLRSLRRRLEEGHFVESEAIALALFHARRYVALRGPSLLAFEADVAAAATGLDATRAKTLATFANRVGLACAHHAPRPTAAQTATTPRASAADVAGAALAATAFAARNDDDHVRRAVAFGWRQSRRRGRYETTLELAPHDPLRAALALPRTSSVATVDRREVRSHLLKMAPLLRQAAAFSPDALQEAMGEELWALCRPVGFGDAQRLVLLVRVPSSTFAQEVQLRLPELLTRVRTIAGLEAVIRVKFVVGAGS
jgi:hypothetical protein